MEALNYFCVVTAIDVQVIGRAVASALCLLPGVFFKTLRLWNSIPLSYPYYNVNISLFLTISLQSGIYANVTSGSVQKSTQRWFTWIILPRKYGLPLVYYSTCMWYHGVQKNVTSWGDRTRFFLCFSSRSRKL